jgi:hypothetical protein
MAVTSAINTIEHLAMVAVGGRITTMTVQTADAATNCDFREGGVFVCSGGSGNLENTLVALVAVMEKEVVVANPVLQKEMTRMVQHVHRLGT